MSAVPKKRGRQGQKAEADLDPVLAMLIVERLKAWRTASGISQAAVAEAAGYSLAWYEKVEKSINVTKTRPNPKAMVPGPIALKRIIALYPGKTFELLLRDGSETRDATPEESSRH